VIKENDRDSQFKYDISDIVKTFVKATNVPLSSTIKKKELKK
jgi:hypothetical protein